MLLIMVINEKGKFYRVYFDTKYDDFIILTPKFGTTRYIPILHFSEEINQKIENRIFEVREILKTASSNTIKAITISA